MKNVITRINITLIHKKIVRFVILPSHFIFKEKIAFHVFQIVVLVLEDYSQNVKLV